MTTTSKSAADSFLEGRSLLIDKPLEWTSFDVVNKIRYALKRRFNLKKIKVGHAGTLDPLATGLLIICTGKSTKKINELMGLPKQYTGIIKLGATTPSYDLETEIDQTFPIDHIDEEAVENVRKQFLGTQDQTPPIFSAIKKDGQKAYDLARSGQTPKMESRKIVIHELKLELVAEDQLHFEVDCSKGTYIRSLAHDIGKALGSGAHLTELRRTRIGEFSVSNAASVDDFIAELGD